jgi:ABC-type multidrug transport system ATPase subunit
MKQRFGIAQLLLNNQKPIIVDELNGWFRPAERHRFWNVCHEIERIIPDFFPHIVDDKRTL